MRKKELLKTAFYLVLYSFIAKVLSLVVRILIGRWMNEEAMTLYSMAAPTMVILITLAQMGIPATLSKILADTGEKRKSMGASIVLSIANNILLCIFFVLFIPLLSIKILKQGEIRDVLYAIVPLIPLVTMTGLLKGYFIGQHHHNPPSLAQIVEELLRGGFILILFACYDISSVTTMATLSMLSIAVGELGSLITLLLFVPKRNHKWRRFRVTMKDMDSTAFARVLNISVPITGSRLVGSMTYFLEPLVMVYRAVDGAAIMVAYGQLNGYVMPIITMPSFLTMTLSSWLLPTFTTQYSSGRKEAAKRTLLIILLICLGVGGGFAVISFMFPEVLMDLMYQKNVGTQMLRLLSFPFVVYTMQPVLGSVLHAMNRSKQSFVDTLCGSVLRLVSLFVLLPVLKEHTMAVSLTLGMLCTTLMHGLRVVSALFFHDA